MYGSLYLSLLIAQEFYDIFVPPLNYFSYCFVPLRVSKSWRRLHCRHDGRICICCVRERTLLPVARAFTNSAECD